MNSDASRLLRLSPAFRQHTGGHTTGPNWPAFLTFAGRYIKSPRPAPTGRAAL